MKKLYFNILYIICICLLWIFEQLPEEEIPILIALILAVGFIFFMSWFIPWLKGMGL